jgi:hypothetical protein
MQQQVGGGPQIGNILPDPGKTNASADTQSASQFFTGIRPALPGHQINSPFTLRIRQ